MDMQTKADLIDYLTSQRDFYRTSRHLWMTPQERADKVRMFQTFIDAVEGAHA